MAKQKFQVRFARPVVGSSAAHLTQTLTNLSTTHGEHLPARDLGGDRYQVRDLQRVGRVWKGTFGKLRDDAPHLVNSADEERELDLEDGDRLLEKCHFLYRESNNTLIWQMNRSSGGVSRFEEYLSQLTGSVVIAAVIMNTGKIEEILNHRVYEISYAYDRPPTLDGRAPKWNQRQFETMKQIDAGHAKFEFRADRGESLSSKVKAMAKQAMAADGVEKIRIRLKDDADPIELFSAPLKDKITVERRGRYPDASEVFEELERAYARNTSAIANETPEP